MAYTPHVLLTFGGTLNELGQQDEIWQCGVRLATTGAFNEHDYLAEIADNMAAWFSAETSMHSNQSKLVWLKAAQIGADGRYPSATYAPAEAQYVSPPGGGGPTVTMPAFCCVAYSWKASTHPRGPASNGRIYPPNFAAPIGYGTSAITDSTALTLVGAAQQLLETLVNGAGDNNASPSIFSKVNGAAGNITSVRIGNVIDTQRRRKLAHPEKYQAGSFPA